MHGSFRSTRLPGTVARGDLHFTRRDGRAGREVECDHAGLADSCAWTPGARLVTVDVSPSTIRSLVGSGIAQTAAGGGL